MQFRKLYHIDERRLETRQLIQRYALIYGRRADAEANAVFAKKRDLLAQHDEALMTYDRLRPSERMCNAPTVRLDRGSRHGLAAVHVPPTLRIGPYNAEFLSRLTGLREAVANSALLGKDRKSFLLQRIEYWERWTQRPLVIRDLLTEDNDHYME